MIIAISDLQVTPMVPTKFHVNWPFSSEKEANKSTASIIPAIAIICLCIKVIIAKLSGKKMTEGQTTILNQIFTISMDR